MTDGAAKIISDYKQLEPQEKIASRIAAGNVPEKRDTGFTYAQRAVFETFDAAEPLRRYAKQAGESETVRDPTVWYYSWLDRGTVIANWFKGGHTVRFDRAGRIVSEPGTVDEYAKLIDGKEKEFNTLLVARRVVEDDQRMHDLLADAAKATDKKERNRLAEEKKRERALLSRYPNKAVHDKERAAALAVADEAIAAAKKSTSDLSAQRTKLNVELEFYKGDMSKVPPQLKRQIEENQQHAQSQERFIANQDNEKQRINTRFDEELAKLRLLWAQRVGAATVGAAPASAAKR